jgi:integral membrane protein
MHVADFAAPTEGCSMTSLRTFRWIAFLEATSFLALLVATYLKATDHGATGVHVLGPVHGALFLLYVGLVFVLRGDCGWDTRTTVLILVGAVVPFGGYVVDWWLLRQPPVAQAG